MANEKKGRKCGRSTATCKLYYERRTRAKNKRRKLESLLKKGEARNWAPKAIDGLKRAIKHLQDHPHRPPRKRAA